MKEILVSGKHYRVLADSVNNIWHRISYWTKASDVQFDDGTYLEGKVFGHCILERNKEYAVGDVAYCSNAPSWVRLKCTTAGRTAATEPSDYKVIQNSGIQINDGTASFKIEDVRPVSELDAGDDKVPSVALVKQTYDQAVTAANQANQISLYVGDDQKLHFVDKAGADTALPFKTHDATYTYPVGSNGSVVDLGVRHHVRNVNAQSVYTQGLADGLSQNTENVKKIEYLYHHHTINDESADNTNQADCPYTDDYLANDSGGCFTQPYYHIYKTHTETYNMATMRLTSNGDWECSVCGGHEGDSGTSTSPTYSHYHAGTRTIKDADYWTTDSTKSPIVATKYRCACGKKNGETTQMKIEYK